MLCVRSGLRFNPSLRNFDRDMLVYPSKHPVSGAKRAILKTTPVDALRIPWKNDGKDA